MNRIDRLIEEALSEEDRAIAEATAERGWFALSLDQFRGKLGWVTWVVMIVQTTMFVAAVWCGKLSLMPQIQADRVLRALRRVELMIAKRAAGQ